jgi:hypothetical protein
MTIWDPVSKQPVFKGGVVRVVRVAASDGTRAPAPLLTAAKPA